MASIHEQIRQLEEELRTTKYNKRTQHHIGLVKAKLARLRERLEQSQTKKSGGSSGFAVKKSGHATVAFLGLPSVGKSSLLSILTSAESKQGAYAFTTTTVIPGILHHRKAQIQLLDLPGILQGASLGIGRGREVLSILRQAELILFILAPPNPEEQLTILEREAHAAGLRFTEKPDITIKKEREGGIRIYTTVPLTIPRETIEGILREYKLANATIIIRQEISIDDLIDAIHGNRVYTRRLVIMNKSDLLSREERDALQKTLPIDLFISTQTGENIETLKDLIYEKLRLIRIYLKEVGKKPDMEEPLILPQPVTVEHVLPHIHRDLKHSFRYARIWGKSAKFPGQKVGLHHQLEDEDIVEVHA